MDNKDSNDFLVHNQMNRAKIHERIKRGRFRLETNVVLLGSGLGGLTENSGGLTATVPRV
jgi:hypothetical protein